MCSKYIFKLLACIMRRARQGTTWADTGVSGRAPESSGPEAARGLLEVPSFKQLRCGVEGDIFNVWLQ